MATLGAQKEERRLGFLVGGRMDLISLPGCSVHTDTSAATAGDPGSGTAPSLGSAPAGTPAQSGPLCSPVYVNSFGLLPVCDRIVPKTFVLVRDRGASARPVWASPRACHCVGDAFPLLGYAVSMESVPGETPRSRKGGRVTIREVAREAGVGIGTVSRALNDDPHVSSGTRRRVLAVVRRLRFQPSTAARGLVKGSTQTLGVLVPFFTKHYFLEILRGIEQGVSRSDYSLIIYSVERPEQASAHLSFLSRVRRIDGLIVISLSGRAVATGCRRLVSRRYPVVAIDTNLAGAMNLLPDHELGMYLAVRHLIGLGHERIALVDRPQDPVFGTITEARRQGYRRAFREAGLSLRSGRVVSADYSLEGGYVATRRLLAARRPPTAVACASDLQAMGALRAVEEAGLRVGAEIAVTGYHDVELAQYVGLTTVRIPAFEMGAKACNLLLETLRGSQDRLSSVLSFQPELVVRRTCGAGARRS